MIRPRRNYLLVEPLPEPKTESDTLIVIEDADTVEDRRLGKRRDSVTRGKVLGLGPGLRGKNGIRPIDANIGDVLRFTKNGADEVEHEGQRLYMITENDIMFIEG